MKNLDQHIKIIIVFIMVFICFRAFSQNVGPDIKNQTDKTFTSLKLSVFELKGFENRAGQKIQDFGDYQSLISNKEYDQQLRKQAIQMLENLFVSKSAKIEKPGKELLNTPSANLKEYSKALLESAYLKIEIKIADIVWVSPLELNEKGEYEGIISFTQNNFYFKDKIQIKSSIHKRKAQIVLVKTEKDFGNQKEQVWNVYLGHIGAE